MKTTFRTHNGVSYAFRLDIDPEFMTLGFGQQIESLNKIQAFRRKLSIQLTHVAAKHKSTMKAMKQWANENPNVMFYAQWRADSPHYKDDCVEVFWVNSTGDCTQSRKVVPDRQLSSLAPIIGQGSPESGELTWLQVKAQLAEYGVGGLEDEDYEAIARWVNDKF